MQKLQVLLTCHLTRAAPGARGGMLEQLCRVEQRQKGETLRALILRGRDGRWNRVKGSVRTRAAWDK